jgi:hypothetical protein
MHCFDTETENLCMWKAGKGSKAGMGLTEEHWCQQVLLIKSWEMSSCEAGSASKSELPTSKRWPWVQSMVRAWSVADGSNVKAEYLAPLNGAVWLRE